MKISALPVLFQGDLYIASPVNLKVLHGSIQQSNGDGIALQKIDRMSELRVQCEDTTSGSLNLLLEYDCLLTHLSQALLGAPLPIEFKWKIPITKKKTGLFSIIETTEVTLEEQSSSSINFERVHVLFNAGLITFRNATSLASSIPTVPDSVKVFSKAAGIFVACTELADKCGLKKQANDARLLSTISRGYAQLAMYVKAVNNNSSVMLRSKIAGGAVDLLRDGTKMLYNFALIVAHNAAATVSEENLEYGDALSHYRECLKIIHEANNSKFEIMGKEIKSVFDSLTKDNNDIYMKPIPDVPPEIQSRVVVTDTAYELKDQESPFKSIVPFALRGPLQRYQRESGKIVSDTKNDIPQYTVDGDRIIQNINLRELENQVENLNGIPTRLRVVLLRIKGSNSIEEVLKQLEEMNEKNKKLRNNIEEINEELKKESEENETMRKKYQESWDRQPSNIVGREVYNEIERINKILEFNKNCYLDSKSLILKSESKIKVLMKGEDELMNSLPKNNGSVLKEMVRQMTELFENWNEIKVQREEAMNQIIELQSKHQKTLLEEMKQASDKNTYIDSLIKEFGVHTNEIQKNLNQQTELMNQIYNLHNDILQITTSVNDTKTSVCNEYSEVGEKYISNSLQIVEILVQLESLEEDINKLQKDAKKFCETRKQELPIIEQRAKENKKKLEDERKNQQSLQYSKNSYTTIPQQYPSSFNTPLQENNTSKPYLSSYSSYNQNQSTTQYSSSYITSQQQNNLKHYPSSYSPSNQLNNQSPSYPSSYSPSHQTNQPPSYPSSYATSKSNQPLNRYSTTQTPSSSIPVSSYPSSYTTSNPTQPPPYSQIPQYQNTQYNYSNSTAPLGTLQPPIPTLSSPTTTLPPPIPPTTYPLSAQELPLSRGTQPYLSSSVGRVQYGTVPPPLSPYGTVPAPVTPYNSPYPYGYNPF
ncbi:hypothetical protein, conserved [Entamoeba dispar SAW760]|uniref:BRO1 domain-containing protein n=1 Tax=Entamoeba dispar (strain ATCC PRA-260 / SAW760) TaxID=370354 RepID=B0EJJ0_ENTDS|nr:uncharacterized protein EDI_165740 [Entamoeba dispar SAW760]EDR25312.1 hypothetical protein, conserved [Entamoeba dispar SAW760]|eukprot:EDR25312.1 hypothetical protein, conserved [Entamoeba dispar SAW760]